MSGKDEILQISDFDLIDTDIGLERSALPTDGWLPAVVPGGVHESLLVAGRIDDPYQDQNENQVRWVEERDWWFRTSFAVSVDLAKDERARLVFHGLDTVADVWLNGEELGHHENMFRPAEFDVTKQLRGHNDLLLRFSPPLDGLTVPESGAQLQKRFATLFGELMTDDEVPADSSGGFFTSERLLASMRRKAPCSWGWDFGPRLPSIGIWRPVELRVEKAAVITGHHIYTDTLGADGTATVRVLVEVDSFANDDQMTARVELTSPSGQSHSVELPVLFGRAQGTLAVPEADLWWTHDLGDPLLYDVMITLLAGKTTMDRATDRIGLRTIVLDRSADPEGGNLFRFILNGMVLFAAGRRLVAGGHAGRVCCRGPGPSPDRPGPRRWHEHAAHLGRWDLRARRVLPRLRRSWCADLARLHVRLY